MKIRIGNDLRLHWKIYKDAEPYILSPDSKVRLLDVYNKPVPIECEMKDNIINIIYRGKNQHTCGKYTLLLMENEDKDDMLTVDYQYAFELVKHSINADTDQINTNIIVDVPCLVSNVESGNADFYELPVASETELGGVMPVTKTEDMTQSVGIDAVGRLFTKDNKYDDTQIKQDVANNSSLLGEQKIAIEANTTLIGKNTADIQQHTADIADNVKKIGEINDALLLKADKTELNNLATKSEVEAAKYDDTQIKNDVVNIKADIQKNVENIALKADKTELENLATKDELIPLATKEEVEAAKYTLPIANETTLGGVKVIAKNDKMTQQVGADAEGNLYAEAGGNNDNIINATYAELKALKDDNQLVKGQKYRMTDFVTMISSETPYWNYDNLVSKFKSANHPFDLILTAIDTNMFDYKVNAIKHTDDVYFNNCKLSNWQIWYSFDNDPIYTWCDPNGKGVIYRMIDEFNNDCPYDFKNVLIHDAYDGYDYYTFSAGNNSANFKDITVFTYENNKFICKNNIMKSLINNIQNNQHKYGEYLLNGNSIQIDHNVGGVIYKNTFENNCYSICIRCSGSIQHVVRYNTFGNNNHGHVLNYMLEYNIIYDNCFNILTGYPFKYNIIGYNNNNITIGCGFKNNTIENNNNNIYIKSSSREVINTIISSGIIYGRRTDLYINGTNENKQTLVAKNSAGEIVQQIVGDATGGTYDDTQVKADIQTNTDAIAAINESLNGADATITNINNIIG